MIKKPRKDTGHSELEKGGTRQGQRWQALFFLIASILPGFAFDLQAQGTGAPVRMVAGRQQLKGHLTPAMTAPKATGSLPSSTSLQLSIGLSVTDPAGLASALRDVADPKSAAYRKYLTPEQFTARFAPSAADYQSVIDWAKAKHLSIVKTHSNRLMLDVSGTAADVEQAFTVKLEQAQRTDASTFYRPDREPSLDLKVAVKAITGLDNFERPKTHGGSSPIGNYISKDLRTAYVPGTSLNGAGQSLGILAFDGYKPTDVASYQMQAGLPALVPVNVLAADASGAPAGTAAETVSDVELALAMAPGLKNLTVYIGGVCNDRDSLLNDIAESTPLSLQNSTSFTCGLSTMSIQIFSQMAMQGQSFFVPSGDSGGYPADQQFWDVSNVTVVGGTALSMNGAGTSYQSETTWSDAANMYSSGGGPEYMIPIPSYQQGTTFAPGSGASTVYRNDPDVSMVAQGLYIVSTSPFANGFEGTSASTPLWAGFMALVNQQNASNGIAPTWASPTIWNIGRNPAAYAAGFNDITTGTATSYWTNGVTHSAGPNYDLATGWGTPKSGLIDQMGCAACNGSTASVSAPPMCVAFQSDSQNCGVCGNVCQAGTTCVSGKCQMGVSMGDTHITTFDGLLYDFQAYGDFLLVSTGPSFIVQTRQAQGLPNWPSAATNQAVAMLIGGKRVALFLPPTRLVVDGAPATLADGATLALGNGVDISRTGTLYLIKKNGGESVQVNVQPTWMNVTVALGAAPDGVRGLLGNVNGTTEDDIQTRDGVVLKQPVSFQDLYGRYADSLRITPRESLFGEERAVPAGIPDQPFYAGNLDEAQSGRSRAACKAAGVTLAALLEACTLDVVVLGTDAAAAAFAVEQPPAAVMIVQKQPGAAPGQPPHEFAGLWWILLLILLLLILFWIWRRAH